MGVTVKNSEQADDGHCRRDRRFDVKRNGVAYAAGFMIATALLDLTGIGAGFLIGKAGKHYGSVVVRSAGCLATVAGAALLVAILA